MRYYRKFGKTRVDIDPENGDITIKTRVHPDEIEAFVTLIKTLHQITTKAGEQDRGWGPSP